MQKPQQGQKAMFLNFKIDGVRIRSAKFKNQRRYDRTASKKQWKSEQ